MKKILIYASALLLASCGGGTADSAAEVSADTLAAPGPATATASPDSILQADATSGATAVGNRPTFNGTFVIPPQSHATVTLTMDGTVKSTTLLPGAYVRRGELLATLENPEFIALQQSYLELLEEKNRRIGEMTAQLKRYRVTNVEVDDISREVGVMMENIKAISLMKGITFDVAGTPLDTTLVCVVTPKAPADSIDRTTLASWLRIRTKVDNVKLFVEP